ncbi:MAG: bifunctional phosphopantothenoylcysteine decarboxylase/phosphopantothenate--cysteine ligase CoaBC [Synergistales bacterium]|nr:bifunctional phosphopantothenoylcysteine decarboxylase/phosphopantothenate--cysteine ligase CoaBC [Synergistales bacterium]
MNLRSKKSNVLLCVTGGIAAYKAPHIVRGFVQLGWDVRVILTESAEAFVSPMVLATLSKNRVWVEKDFLSVEGGSQIPHISLAEWADVVIVAPCSADTASRLAIGGGGRLMDSAVLATKAPVLVFPAMNVNMLYHPATRENLDRLVALGYTVVDPDSGDLACGYEGQGRLPDREVILEEAKRALSVKDMDGLSVVVTAGPTREFMDPVRFISNPSSGKMGYALARTAWYRGADVELITGPVNLTPPHGVKVSPVISAQEMLDSAVSAMGGCDIMVKAAAVGDYRFSSVSEKKIKRKGLDVMEVSLINNPDIAATLGSVKRPDQTLVGFAAETDNLTLNATEKLKSKGLDMIVANDLTEEGSGFGSNTNRVIMLGVEGVLREMAGDKEIVADGIWDQVLELRGKS